MTPRRNNRQVPAAAAGATRTSRRGAGNTAGNPVAGEQQAAEQGAAELAQKNAELQGLVLCARRDTALIPYDSPTR